MSDCQEQHFGFVTVLGAPNTGKSTLVNALIGAKITIVSPKVQTTRSRIRGIMMAQNTQIVLVDTPGIFKPSRRLDRAMVAAAWEDLSDSDICLFIVDASKGIDKNTAAIMTSLKNQKQKAILVINKIDLIAKEKLLPLIQNLNQDGLFTETFLISARTKENLDVLKSYLIQHMPCAPWMFPPDQLSDLPNRLFCAEITREKLFMALQQEMPYMISVETTHFEEKEKALRIEQTIYVERPAQKAIVLGKNGSMIKKVGQQARMELSRLFEKKVHLFLFVKIKENWSEDPSQYTHWGLNFNA